MPIFAINNSKLAVMNEEKTRGVSVEYPRDMGLGELLDRINELKDAVLLSIENEKKAQEAPKEEVKAEEKKE